MPNKLERKITDYVTLKMGVAGERYEFTDKAGKTISGVSRETIKLKTPNTTIALQPRELKALISLHKDPEVMNEIEERIRNGN